MTKTKTGVPLGAFAINPCNGDRLPIWIGDYVIGTYGTGAVMAVPAHDDRDHAFAKTYGLPIVQVIAKEDGRAIDVQAEAFTDDGGAYEQRSELPIPNGTPAVEIRRKLTAWLASK